MRVAPAFVLSAAFSALSLPGMAADNGVDPAAITAATTADQHRALADRYRAQVAEAKRDADTSLAMAKAYMGASAPDRNQLAAHCQQIATEYQELAVEYEALAQAEQAAAEK